MKLIAVGAVAAHSDETPARLDPPAIVVETGDGRIALLGQISNAVQQLKKIHSTRIISAYLRMMSAAKTYRGRQNHARNQKTC